jgi:hypothetical protein
MKRARERERAASHHRNNNNNDNLNWLCCWWHSSVVGWLAALYILPGNFARTHREFVKKQPQHLIIIKEDGMPCARSLNSRCLVRQTWQTLAALLSWVNYDAFLAGPFQQQQQQQQPGLDLLPLPPPPRPSAAATLDLAAGYVPRE